MIRLWIVSDLHAEIAGNANSFKYHPIHDVLVLAGDTHRADQAIEHARRMSPNAPIIIVAGNHEHYGYRHSVPRGIEIMREQAAKDRAWGLETWFLENNTITLSIETHRIRFIGATLWVDFALYGNPALGIADSITGLADFREIKGSSKGDRITADSVISWHRRSQQFIGRELKKSFDGLTVVVTHHLPSRRSVSEKFWFSPLSVAFASNCEELLALGADLWIHGHTHESCDYTFSKTRIICNPCGYNHGGQPENPTFDPGLCIEI